MNTSISAKQVIDKVWNSFLEMSYDDYMLKEYNLHIIYMLYGYHKQYPFIEDGNLSFRYVSENDSLLNDLYDCIKEKYSQKLKLKDIYDELSMIPHDDFEKVYADVLNGVNDRLSRYSGRIGGDYFTPPAITEFIAYLINKENYTSVYDPFCGTAAIVHKLRNHGGPIHFEGQDVDLRTSLLARVNVEAWHGNDKSITCRDSLAAWNNEPFDVVASCPPYGLRIYDEARKAAQRETGFICREIENLVIAKSFKVNHVKSCFLLLNMAFTFTMAANQIRKYFVDNNYLDAIISFPPNTLYGTSIPCFLLICKTTRKKDEAIKFIYAESCFIESDRRKRILDVNQLISIMEADDAQECISVSPDVIKRDFDYNLNPSLYLHNNVEIHEGQCLVRLSDVLSLQRPSKNVGSDIELIPVNRFSNEFTKIIFADGKPSEEETISHPNAYKTYHSIVGEKYLLVFNLCTSYASKFALYAGYKDFMCSRNIQVFKINEEIMSSEYLVYNLTNNPLFNKSGLQNYMNMPFVIEKDRERQDAIVERKKQEYREKRRIELQNEEKRLGIKTEISDLEHFIGSQQLKIITAIARIENIAPDTDKYHENVKLLIDNVKYVFRAIKFFRSDISDEELHNGMAEDDICNFINNYIESWNRYSGNFFNLYVNNELDSTPIMEFNKSLLTVMFDTILDNAGRHSFNKIQRPDNQVEINLSLTEYDNKNYLLIKVANNGIPFSKDFTINDYISHGVRSSDTGHYGIGGYHIYKIVKGHNGFLYIDSNSIWNVIIEILLPIKKITGDKNITTIYENNCI